MPIVTRRTLLTGSAAAAFTAGAGPAAAAAPPTGKQTPGIYRYRIGTGLGGLDALAVDDRGRGAG